MVRPVVDWARACYLNEPLPRNPKSELHKVLRIQSTTFIEESIWSVGLGIKGQIDASLRVQPLQPELRDACVPTQSSGTSQADGAHNRLLGHTTVLVPFELKTGKRNQETELRHKAQVMRLIPLSCFAPDGTLPWSIIMGCLFVGHAILLASPRPVWFPYDRH